MRFNFSDFFESKEGSIFPMLIKLFCLSAIVAFFIPYFELIPSFVEKRLSQDSLDFLSSHQLTVANIFLFLLLALVALFIISLFFRFILWLWFTSLREKRRRSALKKAGNFLMCPFAGLVNATRGFRCFVYVYKKPPEARIKNLEEKPFEEPDWVKKFWFTRLTSRIAQASDSLLTQKSSGAKYLFWKELAADFLYYKSEGISLFKARKYRLGDVFKVYIDPDNSFNYFVELE